MQELKIKIPEGFKIDTFDLQTGVVQFAAVPKSPIGRIKTFEAVCQEAGEDISDYTLTGNPSVREIVLNQINRIMLIVEVFNQGHEIKMDDPDQKKWRGWFHHESESGFRFYLSLYSYSGSNSVLGPLLHLQSEEICDYVGETFHSEFEAALMLEDQL